MGLLLRKDIGREMKKPRQHYSGEVRKRCLLQGKEKKEMRSKVSTIWVG